MTSAFVRSNPKWIARDWLTFDYVTVSAIRIRFELNFICSLAEFTLIYNVHTSHMVIAIDRAAILNWDHEEGKPQIIHIPLCMILLSFFGIKSIKNAACSLIFSRCRPGRCVQIQIHCAAAGSQKPMSDKSCIMHDQYHLHNSVWRMSVTHMPMLGWPCAHFVSNRAGDMCLCIYHRSMEMQLWRKIEKETDISPMDMKQ